MQEGNTLKRMLQFVSYTIIKYLNSKKLKPLWIFTTKDPEITIFRQLFTAIKEFKMCLCCQVAFFLKTVYLPI
ncbi:hypothetical protein LX92_03720 [Maribacter polysiphoniae]|uniref:Uncharacterized protein n=1 Tax=Maribacter polysiphoniae TaxID=429344 RepID=A0A316DWK7_9FLAO|nr:hypothetical protein LX92_03720 [Maribacter polysiphoniae]